MLRYSDRISGALEWAANTAVLPWQFNIYDDRVETRSANGTIIFQD